MGPLDMEAGAELLRRTQGLMGDAQARGRGPSARARRYRRCCPREHGLFQRRWWGVWWVWHIRWGIPDTASAGGRSIERGTHYHFPHRLRFLVFFFCPMFFLTRASVWLVSFYFAADQRGRLEHRYALFVFVYNHVILKI